MVGIGTEHTFLNSKKVNRKVQGVPQSQTAANPRQQEEEKEDKNHTRKKKKKMHENHIDQLPPSQARPFGLFCYLLTIHTLYKRGLLQMRPWKGIQGYNSFIEIIQIKYFRIWGNISGFGKLSCPATGLIESIRISTVA